MTTLSFWEKIGFTNSKKRNMMLTQGKQKIDESYNWLKATMIQSKLLRNNLDEKKRKIQELEDEAIRLNQHI